MDGQQTVSSDLKSVSSPHQNMYFFAAITKNNKNRVFLFLFHICMKRRESNQLLAAFLSIANAVYTSTSYSYINLATAAKYSLSCSIHDHDNKKPTIFSESKKKQMFNSCSIGEEILKKKTIFKENKKKQHLLSREE